MNANEISIDGRLVGTNERVFIIAEIGVNHNGSLDIAKKLIQGAAQAGADAVKFQSFQTDLLVTADAPKANYQVQTTDLEESQAGMLRRLELSSTMHKDLKTYCTQHNIIFLSSPFEEQSADFLEMLGVPAFKIPSGEITNLSFLRHVAKKGRPLILSTGMSTLQEVKEAVGIIQENRNVELILLHCVNAYPTNPKDVNLRAMCTIADTFKVPVGFSDHTMGIEVAMAAVALGACVIEKHVTLDRTLPGPDHQASLLLQEFTQLVQGIRHVEAALGHGVKQPGACEANTAIVARKSLVAVRKIPLGSVLIEEMICVKRPGTGLPPHRQNELIGRRTNCEVQAGTLLTLEMLL